MTFRCEQPPSGIASAVAANVAAQIPTLASEAILLRAPKTEDFPLYARIVTSERGHYMRDSDRRDDAWWDFVQLASGWILHGHGGWTIEDIDTGDALGFVILGLEPGDEEIELGYLIDKDHEGLGIAFEAAQIARHFAFDTLKLDTLVSYVHKDNTRSIALAERLGATRARFDDDMLVFTHPKGAAQ
ncbi:MAG: GNAT family N-acetyltransferase [Pseudomonadota bacterium]